MKELTRDQNIAAFKCCVQSKTLGDCRRLKCPALEKDGCICSAQTVEDFMNNVLSIALSIIEDLTKERDDAEMKLAGVMHNVDKWLDGAELEQDEVSRAITMREKLLLTIEGAEARIAKELLSDIERRLPLNSTFNNRDIQIGFAWAMSSVMRILNTLKKEVDDS